MSKVVPIGGSHKSASSLLAEVMTDPNLERVLICGFMKNGEMNFTHFECTLQEFAFASVYLAHRTMRD
jgi:hypothetical protein